MYWSSCPRCRRGIAVTKEVLCYKCKNDIPVSVPEVTDSNGTHVTVEWKHGGWIQGEQIIKIRSGYVYYEE